MKLLLKRSYKGEKYTIGKLFVDGSYYCDVLEDKDRNLSSSMSLEEINKIKIPRETAIPTGTYKITLDVVSPRFSKYPFYMEVCDGKLPRLLNVPGYEGVLIHVGDGIRGPEMTEGCLLIGKNEIVGGLLHGKEVFKDLYNKLLQDKDNLEITIQ